MTLEERAGENNSLNLPKLKSCIEPELGRTNPHIKLTRIHTQKGLGNELYHKTQLFVTVFKGYTKQNRIIL